MEAPLGEQSIGRVNIADDQDRIDGVASALGLQLGEVEGDNTLSQYVEYISLAEQTAGISRRLT